MNQSGFTLVELTVVLVIMSALFMVVGLSVTSIENGDRSELRQALAIARDSSIEHEIPVQVSSAYGSLTFFPDGSASGVLVSDSIRVTVDEWTGRTSLE